MRQQIHDMRVWNRLIMADAQSMGRTIEPELFGIPEGYKPGPLPIVAAGVYVIAPSLDGPSKVGVATDLATRLGGLQVGNWNRLYPAFFAYFYPKQLGPKDLFRQIALAARKVEQATHKRLNERRVSGEWFSVGPEEAAEAIEATIRKEGFLRLKRATVDAVGKGEQLDELRRRLDLTRDMVRRGLDEMDRAA